MNMRTSRDVCIFLAAINIPIYILGKSQVSLITSILMLASAFYMNYLINKNA
jgi:hypothetical protein